MISLNVNTDLYLLTILASGKRTNYGKIAKVPHADPTAARSLISSSLREARDQ